MVVVLRNRLRLLTTFLEHLVAEGSKDVHVHNAIGKILIDTNNNPEHFLNTNPYYDARVVGKHCEKRDPLLACVAYKKGQCDDELIAVTSKNSLFKIQSRYVVERQDDELWAKVLDPKNKFRRQLIDQVVSTALPESKSPEQVSKAVMAFMTADLPHELIELLEKIVLQNSAFSGNPNLQNLLLLTAIKVDTTRVMDYVNRLDNFDGPAVGEIAVAAELYEEAFAIYKKFSHNVLAVNVLLDNIGSIERAVDFATRVEESEVWTQVGKAQLREGRIGDAIDSFIRANDVSLYSEVIMAAELAEAFEELVKYLIMVRKTVKESRVDGELLYAYAKINKLEQMEAFLEEPNVANLQAVGDRCFDEALYEAAKVIFTRISNWQRLASTLLKLKQFQQAVEAARNADSMRTWKEVCFACVDAEEFRLAHTCGLNIIVQNTLDQILDILRRPGFRPPAQSPLLLTAMLGPFPVQAGTQPSGTSAAAAQTVASSSSGPAVGATPPQQPVPQQGQPQGQWYLKIPMKPPLAFSGERKDEEHNTWLRTIPVWVKAKRTLPEDEEVTAASYLEEIDELTGLLDVSEYDGEETAEGSTLLAEVKAKAGGRVKGQPKSQGKAASNQTKVADWVKAGLDQDVWQDRRVRGACINFGWEEVETIEYMSKKMPSKLAKSTNERELYALYKALVHWRHFLLGRFFYLRNDHQTLKWIKTQPALSDALERWIEVIDQYDFKLEYLKGEHNKVADALSRRADYLGALVSEFGVSEGVTQSLVGAYQEDFVTMDIIRKLQAKDNATERLSVSMDFMDTLVTSKSGKRHIFVIIDRFTKYARLVAVLESARTDHVIKLFQDNWVRDFGLPKTIVSDRDVRSTSELWKKTAEQMGSQLKMTSGNHPEANGQAEQINRVVQHLLRHYIKPNQDDWDEKLPLIASLYNNAVHNSTGVSPNQLHLGWKPRSALDFLLPENRSSATPGTLKYGVQYEKLLQQAVEHITKAQQAMIASENKHRRQSSFQVGERVWVKASELGQEFDISRKLMPQYFGPWEVLDVVGDEMDGPTYVIRIPGHLRTHPVFHASKLAPFAETEQFSFKEIDAAPNHGWSSGHR
ncbi:hypothetical protein CBR_g46782 [Chara braunii]|uniref:Integrase catalytic domain-containing protein n=1 Tax=Chara braunii TaxID=69332 RepID=A0A388M0W4_CHABU|nr:hypothetical protein CBR_g46782 [Chara braunii]|eukprot:GBG88214.1 hypothetical protein CBR_g46782 [Chara braunii]